MKESLKSNRQGTRFFSNYLKEKKTTNIWNDCIKNGVIRCVNLRMFCRSFCFMYFNKIKVQHRDIFDSRRIHCRSIVYYLYCLNLYMDSGSHSRRNL